MNETNLKQEVEILLAEIDRTHRYSMSKIYNLTNSIFNNNEIPQSCASCLIRKVRELRNWLASQSPEHTEKDIVRDIVKQKKTRKKKEN